MNVTLKTLVMNFVQSRESATRTEIIQFIHEVRGINFDKIRDRGNYSTAFLKKSYFHNHKEPVGYFLRPSKSEPRYLIQNENKSYSVA